jgi:NADPH:quinone reductase-like Zn-dependent oxidoreductase
MKAVQFSRFGAAWDVADLVELPDLGAPNAGEVVLDILASPINPSDFLNFEGRFGAYAPTLPAAAGGEAVARVAAVGADVTNVKVGDRVLAMFIGRGNWRERVRGKADGLFPLPPEAATLQLAMLGVNPGTAWHMLHGFVELAPGNWIIQNAGTSAVGYHVIKLARSMGVHTVNIVRQEAQVAPLRALGADVALVDGPDLAARVAAATGGAPVRLALDAVAGEATRRLAQCLAPSGVAVIYGLLGSPDANLDAADILFRDVSLRGFWFSAWFRRADAKEKRALYEQILPRLLDHTIEVPIEATYPLERVQDALRHAAQPSRSGKILLTMNGTPGC